MLIFTRSDGKRVAIAAYDIHRVYSTTEPNSCNVIYQMFEDGEWAEVGMSVVGTFDNIMATIEGCD
jgi:hypothetical protein